jgi:hypothetical protein
MLYVTALLLWIHQSIAVWLGYGSAAGIFFGGSIERVVMKQVQLLIVECRDAFEVVDLAKVAVVSMAPIRVVCTGLVALHLMQV